MSSDIARFETAIAERHLPHLIALASEHAPREMVRAVLAFPDHHVLAAVGGSELRGYEPRRSRHRRNQRNVGSVSAHQCAQLLGTRYLRISGELPRKLRQLDNTSEVRIEDLRSYAFQWFENTVVPLEKLVAAVAEAKRQAAAQSFV